MPKNSKPYMLLCTLHCPNTTSFFYLRSFRKLLGEENVVTCGPERSSISWDLKKGNNDQFSHNVEMPKKDHPHIYTYAEIFDKCREKGIDTNFDYILVFEPNFSPVVGTEGFRPNCHISYAQVDDHRGPRTALKYITLGQCDSYIHPNEYYREVFEYPHIIDGVKYSPEGKKLIVSKTCYEEGVHEIYPDCEDFEKYDVVFVGNDGIAKDRGGAHENFMMSHKWLTCEWKDDRGNVYRTDGPNPVFNHGCPEDHRFFEYADRAELLCRLRKDFPNNFKILPGTLHPVEYAKLLNRGKIVVNMSIAQDLNMRIGEAMGCGRVLLADECEGMDSVCGENWKTHVRFRKFYNPLNVNWDLTYDIITNKIRKLLSDQNRLREIQKNAYEWIRSSGNSYVDRCKLILEQTIGWKE